jgi:AcrR family transcriptional regulator
MDSPSQPRSRRRDELLERAYDYVLAHGLSTLSLRPLAAAIGSSPRVLLFLFGSKDGLVRALLERARADELAFVAELRDRDADADLRTVVAATWTWLADPLHRPVLRLWADAYARSLTQPDGPWREFAAGTVADWLEVLASAQPPPTRATGAGAAERTLALAVLRGALLDLLASGDQERTSAAVARHTESLGRPQAGTGTTSGRARATGSAGRRRP